MYYFIETGPLAYINRHAGDDIVTYIESNPVDWANDLIYFTTVESTVPSNYFWAYSVYNGEELEIIGECVK